MGLFDQILGQVSGNPMVVGLAEKFGIDPAKAAEAVAALGEAHGQDGDTISLAAAKTGISPEMLNSIREQLGGDGALGKVAGMLDRDGDGNPLNDIMGMAGSLFGKK